MSIETEIRSFAIEKLGFDDCGFCSAMPTDADIAPLARWLSLGYQGGFEFFNRHFPIRKNPNLLLDGVQSAVVVLKNYKNTNKVSIDQAIKVARYVAGKDYHDVVGGKLEDLTQYLKTAFGSDGYDYGVDTKPINEKLYAAKSGLGFIGKNTLFVHPRLGSYCVLGVVLTTARLETLNAKTFSGCGSCRRCVDACPTGAITPDGIDVRRCISYWNKESKKNLSDDDVALTGGWIAGCDICQQACPVNRPQNPVTDWPEFLPEAGIGFDFFDRAGDAVAIPPGSTLYRVRDRICENYPKYRARFRPSR